MSRVSKIKYNPHLSISENAKINGVSEASIRYHIQSHFIDRRKEAKTNVINSIKKYLNEHPNASRNEIHKELGYSLSTIRKYWPFVVGEKRLTEHNSKKKDNQYQQYVNKLSQIPIGVIRKYLAEQEESGRQVSKPKHQTKSKAEKKEYDADERKSLIDELKEVEKKNSESLQSLPCPKLEDLRRWEEYDASKYLCYAFRKKPDKRKGVWIPFGNMNSGIPYNLCGDECLTSESAYICGLFSDNTPEHISIQERLLKENNGRKAKKDIRHANEGIARKDWYDFNVQWMLFVVWQKIKGNEEFRQLLMAAIIIEDTTFQHGSKVNDTTTFWGAKNNERKDFDALVKKYIGLTEEDAKKGTKKRLKAEEVNNFTDYGTFRGSNVMGKILSICRKCIQDGTEPDIDYKLLRSKHIHLLGKELTFDKPLDIK